MEDENREAKWTFLGRFVIEVLGTPKEHVTEAITAYIAKLKDDPELKVEHELIAEPEPKGNAFATYAELEVWFKGLENLFAFCLDAMPSSVEILEPSDIRIDSFTLTNMLNDLQAKMHEVDMLVKRLRVENKTLKDNSEALLQNAVTLALKSGNKTEDQIGSDVGITGKQLKPFLDAMIEDKKLELVDGTWYKNVTR